MIDTLSHYRELKSKIALNEEYLKKLGEFRTKIDTRRAEVEEVTKQVQLLKERLAQVQSASFLDKMKKKYGDETPESIQQKINERQNKGEKLTQAIQSMTKLLEGMQARSPVSPKEMQEFEAVKKKIDASGGEQKFANGITTQLTIDTKKFLEEKKLIATSISRLLNDAFLANHQVDALIVDNVHSVPISFLFAISTVAKEKVVVGGDPILVPPASFSQGLKVREWLQGDLFWYASQGKELKDLFAWQERFADMVVFLDKQYRISGELSSLLSEFFYDKKIQVQTKQENVDQTGKIFFIDTITERSAAKQFQGTKKLLTHNETHARLAVDCIKHAMMRKAYYPNDIGIIFPFPGATQFAKQQLRINGMNNIEVGTVNNFECSKKDVMVFDTVMAGVDYTMRPIDDTKTGYEKVARLLNTALTRTRRDLYVIADMSHFESVYKGRLVTTLLERLKSLSEKKAELANAMRIFSELPSEDRAKLFVLRRRPMETVKTDIKRPGISSDMIKKVMTETVAEIEKKMREEAIAIARRVLALRSEINLMSLSLQFQPPFKHSPETAMAAAALLKHECKKEDFKEIIDLLYLCVFDSPGGYSTDNPFFIKSNADARVRWDLALLYNYYHSESEALSDQDRARATQLLQSRKCREKISLDSS